MALLGLLAGTAFADKAPPQKKAPAAGSAAEAPAPAPDPVPQADPPGLVRGPKLVDLGNNSEIDLPAGMLLLQKAQAQEALRPGGGNYEHVVALIGTEDKEWQIVLEYEDLGYIEDDDADKLDANELLQSYKDGTTEQNKARKQNGIPELYVDGWSESPRYEKAKHHLVWGLKGHSTNGPIVNYFTRILSRGGFMSVDLIDKPENMEKSKVEAAPVLTAIHFKPGFAYADHKSDDKSSGMGLRALVLGGAGVALATKGGFLIKLLIIFKKAIVFVVVGIGGFFKWLFGRKKKTDGLDLTPPPYDPNNPGPPPAPPHDTNQV